MVLTPNIRNLIRDNKLHQIYGMMQIGQEKSGMQTMNQCLFDQVMKRKVDLRQAFMVSPDPEELDKMFKKAGV
jgi:twitching motility protein PilT